MNLPTSYIVLAFIKLSIKLFLFSKINIHWLKRPYEISSLCLNTAVSYSGYTDIIRFSPHCDKGDEDCDDDVDVDDHLEDLPWKAKGKSITKQGVRLIKAQLTN